jgi:lipopolysaccharide export system permease protein
MDYPIINGYNQINAKINTKIGLIISIFIPIGLPIYLLATYQRKLLRHDIQLIQKTSQDLIEIIEK